MEKHKEWRTSAEESGAARAESLRGVIFDLDGTLVSSSLDFARIRAEIDCPRGKDVLTHINEMQPEHRLIAERIVADHEARDAEQCERMPGVSESLNWLHEQGLQTAVVTRNSRSAARLKLDHTGLKFDVLLTREDAPPKPHPGGLLQVARHWGLAPWECAYVGDFLYDVEAALAARMQAWLYTPGALPEYAHRADIILRHFSELPGLIGAGLPLVEPGGKD